MNYLDYKLKILKYKLKYQQIINNNNKQTNLKKNDYAIYLPKNQKVKILDVHHNDIEPYYTISLSGTERQTVIKNLVPL
tara:strand:+ start:672 stop:908 length:237 start_codon:yes stop_codon:yes gene_type:complete